MTTQIEFLGLAAYRITNSEGKVILIDPYLDENPSSAIKVKDLERVDLICVTHLAFDHLGDTESLDFRHEPGAIRLVVPLPD